MKESSISHIITQLRVLNAACKETRTAAEWEQLENDHKMIAFSDLETDRGEHKSFMVKRQATGDNFDEEKQALRKGMDSTYTS